MRGRKVESIYKLANEVIRSYGYNPDTLSDAERFRITLQHATGVRPEVIRKGNGDKLNTDK